MVSIKPVDFLRDGILLAGAAIAFGYIATPNNPFMTGVSAHPYFVVVVLLAARYGMIAGLISTTALTVIYILGGLAQPGDNSAIPPLLESPHVITISGLFLFAVIIGAFSDAFRHRIKIVEAKIQDQKEHLTALNKQNELLIQTNRELRNRIMEESPSFQTLFEMAHKLCTRNGQIVYSVVLDILEEHLQAERSAFYLVKGNMLQLAACIGWDKVLEQDQILSIDHCKMIKQAISEKKLVSLRDFVYRDERTLGDRIVAAPVCSQTDGKVIGVITIEKIPFDRFTPQSLRILSLVADWTAKTLTQSSYALAE
jgi:hypothetical protein